MEDADFEDCGVPLESCLDKLETKVCSKVEEAKNEITRGIVDSVLNLERSNYLEQLNLSGLV